MTRSSFLSLFLLVLAATGNNGQTTPNTNPGGDCVIGASDFVFVMDQSGSIGYNDFQLAKLFAAQLTQYMTIGSANDQSQVGMVLFDAVGTVEFYLNAYNTSIAVYSAIMGIPYSGGGTNIANGMTKALDEVFIGANGNRPAPIPSIMFVMTDGADASSFQIEVAHNRAEAQGIVVFAIGVGSAVDQNQLLIIAGDPRRVFNVNDFGSLHDFLPQLCTQLTGAAPQPTTALYPSSTTSSGGGPASSMYPSSTTSSGGGPPIFHNPHQCACTSSKIWLDIVVVVEVSDSMTAAGLNQAKAMLAPLIGALPIDRNKDMTSRVAIVYFSQKAVVLGDLRVYGSPTEAMLGIYAIPFIGDFGVDLEAAFQSAAIVLNRGARTYTKSMIIMLTSSNQNGQFLDPKPITDQLKSQGITIVTIAFAQTDASDPPNINFASPGYNFTSRDSGLNLRVLGAFCETNCFCPSNWYQFGDNLVKKYGECIYPGDFATTWTAAQIACSNTRNGYLADELSVNKQTFLKDHAVTMFSNANPFGYWVGLKYDNGQPTWDRNSANDSNTISGGDFTNWAPGSGFPSAAGNCVAELYYFGTFATKWQVKECSSPFTATYNYFCQRSACDTDTWCY